MSNQTVTVIIQSRFMIITKRFKECLTMTNIYA